MKTKTIYLLALKVPTGDDVFVDSHQAVTK